jgi:acyl CoA:acetate/3-ketoacid CoA transferase
MPLSLVSTVGIFQLTSAGLALIRVMLGVDIEKDMLNVSTSKINVPNGEIAPLASNDLFTGTGFFT